MHELSEEQKALLDYARDSGALKLATFILKNGRKSPWFWNAGNFLGNGEALRVLGDAYAEILREEDARDGDYIVGPALKGNDLSQAVAMRIIEPSSKNDGKREVTLYRIIDRKEPKDHGEATDPDVYWDRWFSGKQPRGKSNIWMVDDVMTTGGTKYDLIKKLDGYFGKDSDKVVYLGLILTVDRQELNDEGKNSVSEFESTMPVYSILNAYDVYTYLSDEKNFSILKGMGHAREGDLERMYNYLLTYGTDELKTQLEA